ncbi:MAG: imidazole glycerol phosphate synthase subunit HisF [Rhodospirillales bacterium]|nr:imidazole glycerol phosphate synthase subunit HisF [Rhodospirillales bacterium]
MSTLRLIARLDVKAPNLIKGVHLEGLRKLGDPRKFAQRYYADGVDEIVYIDAVASLYERNTIVDLVRHTAEDVFIPITAGGGVRSVEAAQILLRAGADKIAINTAATQNPELIRKLAERFGSQCVVLSIEAKRQKNHWEAYCDNGRERTGLDVIEWSRRGEKLGAGEILLTSVDCEGTRGGYDIELTRAVADAVGIPVIASGGMGKFEHLGEVVNAGHADAVAMAHVLHFEEMTIPDIRRQALAHSLNVRPV